MQVNYRRIRFAALLIAVVFSLSAAVGHLQADSSAGNALAGTSPFNAAGGRDFFFAPAPTPQGSVISATVTRVGSNFQISWTTTGDVTSVEIKEGTSPEQI